MEKYLRNSKPQRKPVHDLSIRLGNKKDLKVKLQEIAGKNQISMNRLLIFIIEDWLKKYNAVLTKLL